MHGGTAVASSLFLPSLNRPPFFAQLLSYSFSATRFAELAVELCGVVIFFFLQTACTRVVCLYYINYGLEYTHLFPRAHLDRIFLFLVSLL